MKGTDLVNGITKWRSSRAPADITSANVARCSQVLEPRFAVGRCLHALGATSLGRNGVCGFCEGAARAHTYLVRGHDSVEVHHCDAKHSGVLAKSEKRHTLN